MSRQLINEYRSDLDRIIKVGGTLNEGTVRDAFQSLLKSWGRSHDLTYLSEHKIVTPKGNSIWVDGALVYDIRVPFGYWEAKDSRDDLEEEIRKKEAKGYPRTNIIYEDTRRAILIQDRQRVAEADMADTDQLYQLLTKFFAYEQQAIRDFRKAIAKFAEDLPAILDALRTRIREKRETSLDFAHAEEAFLKQVKETINPALERADVTEMLIQHILTADIFNRVFDMRDYHHDNNIAKQLDKLDNKLFEYGDRRSLLQALRPYYTGIEETAHLIQSHSEKQNFLKSLYENFYKVYNPKAADRLGVVYTPGEIVRFMIRSADWLCEKHFGKNLIDPGVEILDPATGTGTYIVELLEYFRGQPDKLRHKYKEELHANEVAILPYYVANLNIEATYQAITGQFAEFEGLCLVDTLDNVDGLGIHSGHQFDLLGGLSDENIERVKRQNRRKISVIIGNPPYNANQRNENDNNKNREYPHIDERIRRTYIKESTAQKTKLYDMYSRFYRWASDRLGDEGIIAFVTNRSFVESRTFDGFRKIIGENFADIWVLDLGGDVRVNPKLSGTVHNVFGIQTGVAIMFLVRNRKKQNKSIIHYARRPEMETAEEKLSFLGNIQLANLPCEVVKPDRLYSWINQADFEDWDQLVPLASKSAKSAKTRTGQKAIFQTYSLGVVTARDDWAYDRSRRALSKKIQFFIQFYNEALATKRFDSDNDTTIKWTRSLRWRFDDALTLEFDPGKIRSANYRPFAKRELYYDSSLNEMQNLTGALFSEAEGNPAITIMGDSTGKPYFSLALDKVPDLNFVSPASGGSQTLSRFHYNKSGERIDNITDWALNRFVKQYGKKAPKPDGGKLEITKDAIFAYCYAVLHDPVYREKYALNLKREFPRIPFYPDFAQWVEWGERLLGLHIDYEDVEPYPLERVDTPHPKRAEGSHPRPKLKSQSENGVVVVDEDTQITGIPAGAWNYRLGNRSAIDWVLDQHKEKKPRDPTIAAKFNTYRFADYKESMIELLAKVVKVSVETNAVTDAMAALDRSDWEETKSP
ncbi:type ISP restriction/modification enzyme [Qipengyuania sp.]|uniref:type ISP restriction/modification enzyme n=1 Tax=Qipengyuania sp. TaxID=2004515 RepID=UPI0035C7DB3B